MRMNAMVLAATVVLCLGVVGNAFGASNKTQGTMGISVGMGDSVFSHKAIPGAPGTMINDVVDINGRYFVQRDVAVTGGIGLQSDSGDASGTYFSLNAGARKYLNNEDLAPFVGGQFTYASVSAKNQSSLSVFDIAALFGAEYSFSRQFSLEGAVGFGLGQAKAGGVTDNYFGTRTVGVHANFYF